MYNNQLHIKPKYILLIILECVFLGIAFFIFYNIFTAPTPVPKISINNINSYLSNTPKKDLENIYSQLYSMAAKNSSSSAILPDSGATIRENSLTTNDSYKSFIVDLPFIENSFLVQYTSGEIDSGYPILVSCLPENQRIYSNSCSSEY